MRINTMLLSRYIEEVDIKVTYHAVKPFLL